MKNVQIAPSVLGVPCLEAPEVINNLISAGADMIHYDVMDGRFVSNKSFPIEEYEYHKGHVDSSIIFDVHLMTYDLVDNIKKFAKGATYITFHYEAIENNKIEDLITLVKSFNVKVGISICPDTDVKVLDPYLKDLDLVLVMSVVPGKGGQSFMDVSLNKISYLNQFRKDNKLS